MSFGLKFKFLGEVLLAGVIDAVNQSHSQIFVKLDEQLELQGKRVKKMVNLQEEILWKLEQCPAPTFSRFRIRPITTFSTSLNSSH